MTSRVLVFYVTKTNDTPETRGLVALKLTLIKFHSWDSNRKENFEMAKFPVSQEATSRQVRPVPQGWQRRGRDEQLVASSGW